MSSHPVLPAKYRFHWIFYSFKLAQIALVGPGIYPQNGQKDDFTLGLHIYYRALFGDSVGVKPPLTSVFIQRLASTHSQAWGFQIGGFCRRKWLELNAIRVCIALNFVRKLKNNIPSKTYKNYNKVWKSSPGVFCWVFMASQSFWRPFWAVYHSPSFPRAVLIRTVLCYEKVGSFKSKRPFNSLSLVTWPWIVSEAGVDTAFHM